MSVLIGYLAIALLLCVIAARRDQKLWAPHRSRKSSWLTMGAFSLFWLLTLDLMFSPGPSWRDEP